ncbi:MAG: amino acid permease [Acidobacteria bacterium]|nr:amino acid permease [Acidobacteriota bacterium]
MNKPPALNARLGLVDATTLVVGSMIGSGVFVVAADIARQVQSPGLLLIVWIATAVMTMVAALSYGELAAMMPQAGGQYVYLREAFGPLPAFLYGWTLFLVIQTGTMAAVAVAFAKFLGVFIPLGPREQQMVAIAVLVSLAYINTRGVREGVLVQNVFTVAKVGALLGLIGLGLWHGHTTEALPNFDNFWQGADWSWTCIRLVGVAMVGSLFSSDAWNCVTFTAGETKDPKRNVPLSLALGVAIVSLLYLGANYVYVSVLPLAGIANAAQDRVGTAAAQALLGDSAQAIMAIAIMISTFGCVNGLTMAGARVYYAMALDGLFFKKVAQLDSKTLTPNVSLWAQCLWACVLTLSGRYGDLLDYVIFAVLLFYALTICGVFVLRVRRPDAPRPYRAIGYPVVPALYIVAALTIEWLLLLYKPSYTWPGLIIVLLGVPVFYIWRGRGKEVKG